MYFVIGLEVVEQHESVVSGSISKNRVAGGRIGLIQCSGSLLYI